VILSPSTEAERILALDMSKGQRAEVTFESGRKFKGRIRGHAPQGGYRRWSVGHHVIGHRTIKSIEIEV
jgi:hypothetical protein